ncbi:hypothetical protein LSAT2_028423 [Lamellibrachia satsuma]|nr:hypothetical protein LSAT2_028423 [Lamellibrachia satsuma]
MYLLLGFPVYLTGYKKVTSLSCNCKSSSVTMVQMRMEGFKKVHTGDDLERVIEKDDSNSSVTESDEGKEAAADIT